LRRSSVQRSNRRHPEHTASGTLDNRLQPPAPSLQPPASNLQPVIPPFHFRLDETRPGRQECNMFGFTPAPCGCFSGNARSLYRAHFCGLSNSLRRTYGLWSRLLVNRDSAFLALIGSAIQPQGSSLAPATCCHPFGAEMMLLKDCPPLRYSAAVTVCGLAAKLDDDGEDESGLWSEAARGLRGLLSGAVQRATAELTASGFPVERVRSALVGQKSVEKPGAAFEEAAAATRDAYGEIFACLPVVTGASGRMTGPLRAIGESLGSMIYLDDAWRDFSKDRRTGKFNPLPVAEAEGRAIATSLFERDLKAFQSAFGEIDLLRHQALASSLALQALPAKVTATLKMDGTFSRWMRKRIRAGELPQTNGSETVEMSSETEPEEEGKPTKKANGKPQCAWCCDSIDCGDCACGLCDSTECCNSCDCDCCGSLHCS